MALKIFIGVAVLLAAFLGYVANQPSEFKMQRSAQIKAPREIIFSHVNDLRRFNEWNPWAKLDPNSKMTFEGPPAGIGSRSIWEGNSQIGSGAMTVIESEPGQRIKMQLDFKTPMEGTSFAEFTFNPEGDQTRVSWTMTGKAPFLHKLICVFMDMDKIMGSQFEKGLTDLKAIAEAESLKQ